MPPPGLSTGISNQPTPETAGREVALLELDHVSKSFGRVPVADDLNLQVGADEIVGVVGPNGAGKTSLFSIISGDLAPDRGKVVFAGRLVNRLDAASRCRMGIGRTYQVPRPFEQMTVFENVLVAAQAGAGLRRRAAEEQAFSVLLETGLAGDANRRAGELGLLDRKRLELARALATGPRLLLLDEVAAGLTDPEVDELIAIVRRARATPSAGPATGDCVAVIWVEHVVRALASTVERLICLDEGMVIADGRPEEVLADPRVKEVYLGTDEPAAAGEGPVRRPAQGAAMQGAPIQGAVETAVHSTVSETR
jgi:branched-chain amino acid transport system ATP-binding protein